MNEVTKEMLIIRRKRVWVGVGWDRVLRGFGATRKDWTKAGEEFSEKGTQLPRMKTNVNLKHRGWDGACTSDGEVIQESCGLIYSCNNGGRGARQEEPFMLRS